jgi:2-keto-4-pentenoate hydratase/2-oxohepta-3-ene-1,7-dioic acid hydratase in catechol pathway
VTKIIRFMSVDEQLYWGVPDHPQFKIALPIKGSIFDSFEVTSERVEVKKLLAPVSPPNILGIGLNYKRHRDETGIKTPDKPVMFMKATGAITGPDDPIILPRAGPDQVDYEAELAVVIGKKAKNVSPDEAMDYVLGYTCANDVSARDWQIRKQKSQWVRAKNFDTFCPLGPCLVTKDEIPNPHQLSIQSEINGKILQDSNTSDMIFDVRTIVSDLSQSTTLFPGTVILTGTPHGVGFTRIPPVYLRPGDTVSIQIEKIGKLTNPVILEE